MKHWYRRLAGVFVLTAIGVFGGGAAFADGYPERPVRWLVPFAAGGSTDFVSRTLGDAITRDIGGPVVIENKPGGNTMIAGQDLVNSPKDGYSVFLAGTATLALNQALERKASYNVEKDFAFVGGVARFPFALMVPVDSPYQDWNAFLAAARAAPGKLVYGTPGLGGLNHVSVEMIAQRTGTSFVHVPYRGTSLALADLVAHRLDFALLDVLSANAFLKAGKLRVLAVASANRLLVLPDVKTLAELGIPGVEAYSWQGLVAPAGTPPERIEKFAAALHKALDVPSISQRIVDMGAEPWRVNGDEFRAYADKERKHWTEVIRAAGIRVE